MEELIEDDTEFEVVSRELSNLERDKKNREKGQRNRAELEAQQRESNRAEACERKEAADFCNEVFGYLSEIGSEWKNITDLDDQLTSREYVEEPTTPTTPFSPSSICDDNLLRCFREIFPDHIWGMIHKYTQSRIDRNETNLSGEPKYKPFTPGHTQRVILAQIQYRISSHKTATEYFKHLQKGKARRLGVANDLFWRISANLCANYTLVGDTISLGSRRFLDHIGNLVLDESVIHCLAGDAPSVFIPRKPHPKGIRFYLLCARFQLSKRAFCVKIIPDLEHEKKLTVDQLFQSINLTFKFDRQVRKYPFVMTVDAFFSINSLLSNPSLQYDFTASWNKGRKREFWRILFHSLEKREFRVVKCGRYIASAFRDEHGSDHNQRLFPF